LESRLWLSETGLLLTFPDAAAQFWTAGGKKKTRATMRKKGTAETVFKTAPTNPLKLPATEEGRTGTGRRNKE